MADALAPMTLRQKHVGFRTTLQSIGMTRQSSEHRGQLTSLWSSSTSSTPSDGDENNNNNNTNISAGGDSGSNVSNETKRQEEDNDDDNDDDDDDGFGDAFETDLLGIGLNPQRRGPDFPAFAYDNQRSNMTRKKWMGIKPTKKEEVDMCKQKLQDRLDRSRQFQFTIGTDDGVNLQEQNSNGRDGMKGTAGIAAPDSQNTSQSNIGSSTANDKNDFTATLKNFLRSINLINTDRDSSSSSTSSSSSSSSSSNDFNSWLDELFDGDLSQFARTARRTRLLASRSYAKKEAFTGDDIFDPPKLSDLSPPISERQNNLGISTPKRIVTFVVAFLGFPYIVRFLDVFVTMPPEQLDQLSSRFGPGISILYGTFVSLTLSILYRRQQDIQDHVATESSLLVYCIRNLLGLFSRDSALAIEAGQCAADQLRTLVRSSRGAELMLLMYSDPYARMLELIDRYEDKLIRANKDGLGVKGVSKQKEGGGGRARRDEKGCLLGIPSSPPPPPFNH